MPDQLTPMRRPCAANGRFGNTPQRRRGEPRAAGEWFRARVRRIVEFALHQESVSDDTIDAVPLRAGGRDDPGVALEHERRRARHKARRSRGVQLTLSQARANKLTLDWTGYRPPVPQSPGVHRFDDYPLSELVDYIDWMPFFNAC